MINLPKTKRCVCIPDFSRHREHTVLFISAWYFKRILSAEHYLLWFNLQVLQIWNPHFTVWCKYGNFRGRVLMFSFSFFSKGALRTCKQGQINLVSLASAFRHRDIRSTLMALVSAVCKHWLSEVRQSYAQTLEQARCCAWIWICIPKWTGGEKVSAVCDCSAPMDTSTLSQNTTS